MCDATKKVALVVKENCETYLEVHCVMQLLLSYKMFS